MEGERRGFILGFKMGGKGGLELEMTHLLFVDDTLIFYDASQEQLKILSWSFM